MTSNVDRDSVNDGDPHHGNPQQPWTPSPHNGWPAQQFAAVPPPGFNPDQLPPQAYAFWGRRVTASIVDGVASIPFLVAYLVCIFSITTVTDIPTYTSSQDYSPYGYPTPPTPHTSTQYPSVALIVLTVVLFLLTLGFNIWNRIFRQGRTGSSLGKQLLGITVIAEQTSTPIGAGRTFLRQLAHIVDGFCYIGYLWPLWDPKRQTFADKIMTTVVVPRSQVFAPGEASQR